MRKIVSLVLAVLILCAMIPVTVYAGSTDPHGVTLIHNYPAGTEGRCKTLTYYFVGAPTTLPTPAVLDNSYTFLGWYDNPGLTGTPVKEIPAHSDGPKTFYGKWGKVYKITWHKNGGTLTRDGALVSYIQGDTHETDYIAGTVTELYFGMQKVGYVFLGWYADPDFTGNPVTEIGADETGDKEFWARFCNHSNTTETKLPKNGKIGADTVCYYRCEDCGLNYSDSAMTQLIGDEDAVKEWYWANNECTERTDIDVNALAALSCPVTREDKAWGVSGKTKWYVVNENVTLNDRPVVNGDVRIILTDNTTLTANNGITVEGNNSISFYAQSDAESTMGKLIATTGGRTAIGGNNGGNGGENNNGGNGTNCGNVYVYGGLITLETSGVPCIGGGNGGNGGAGTGGGKGGAGGIGGNTYFSGGKSTLKSSDAVCIGGGNGGKGGNAVVPDVLKGSGFDPKKGDGGKGGDSGKVYFYGGDTVLKNNNTRCIGGGKGGNGGTGSDNGGSYGQPGSSADCCNVTGSPVLKAGKNEQSAGSVPAYTDELYLSVQYGGASLAGSVFSAGNIWVIIAVAVVALGGVAVLVIVMKKKKIK